ncbi:MAG: hypothetical protein R3200_04330 [Xanthomonadales bacterium]|nr:hypothetical protein [Xanthomonadales bacterium]
MKTLSAQVVLSLVLVISVCSEGWANESDEAVIHAAIVEWSAAAQAKDPDAFVSVYAPDAMLLLEGAPDMRGV